jgi:hypothetical protein
MSNWLRWATSVGFLLAGLALALPALSLGFADDEPPAVRVEVRFSALDAAVNGTASGEFATQDPSGSWQVTRVSSRFLPAADPHAQAAGVLTLIVLAAGAATTLLRGRTRAAVALGAAALAALTVTATVMWTQSALVTSTIVQELMWDPSEPDLIGYSYGFWVVLGLLAATALVNVPAAFVGSRPSAGTPARSAGAPSAGAAA